jgi:hypothetical protein
MLIQFVQLIKMIFDVAGAIAVRSAALFEDLFTRGPVRRHNEAYFLAIG